MRFHPSLILIFLAHLLSASCTGQASKDEKTNSFRLEYVSVGLGSNLVSMQPVFRIDGTKFIYTSEQTSFYNDQERKPADTICTGSIRRSTIDSIIDIADEIEDTLVYRTNIHIMSGGIHYINISHDSIDLQFKLHNASDARAEKIVKLLNSYIPVNEKSFGYLISKNAGDEEAP